MGASGKLVPLALLGQAPSFQMLSVDYTIITTLKRLLIVPMIRIGIGIPFVFFLPASQTTIRSTGVLCAQGCALKKAS